MITPDMIDPRLAERIAASGDFSNWTNVDFVKGVLAWLANNPIQPTQKQSVELNERALVNVYKDSTMGYGDCCAGFHSREFQRIAYLKKEEPIPQELKDIYAEHGFCSEDVMDALQKAYKLGKGESK